MRHDNITHTYLYDAHIYTCIDLCMSAYIHTYIHVYISRYSCMSACINIESINTYIPTHIYTPSMSAYIYSHTVI